MKEVLLGALRNWKTSVGGILLGVPPLIAAAGFVLTPAEQHWSALCQGVGGFLLGLAAKDATTHSTVAQVQTATIEEKVNGKGQQR